MPDAVGLRGRIPAGSGTTRPIGGHFGRMTASIRAFALASLSLRAIDACSLASPLPPSSGSRRRRSTSRSTSPSGLPGYNIVGLPDAGVKEGRVRIRGALENSGFKLPARRIIVNLAPADLRKDGAAFDVPIAVGVLCAAGIVDAGGARSESVRRRARARRHGAPGARRAADRRVGARAGHAPPVRAARQPARGDGRRRRLRGRAGVGAQRGRRSPARRAGERRRRAAEQIDYTPRRRRRRISPTCAGKTSRDARSSSRPPAATTCSSSARPGPARPCSRGGCPGSCRRCRSTRRWRRPWSTRSPACWAGAR